MKWKTTKKVAAELERIRKAHGGILRPADVVREAKAKTSPLHKCFEWDDSKAAARFRLEQARQIIRCTVTLVGTDPTPIRAYASLESDRASGDSYREITSVVSSRTHYEELLAQGLREANSWAARYQRFKELGGIVREIRRATANSAHRSPRVARKTRKRRVA